MDTADGGPARATYKFVVNGAPFYFKNNAGQSVDNQIIKNGEYLEDVGLPTISSTQSFDGWFVTAIDKEGVPDVAVGDKIVFGEENPYSVTTDFDYTVTVTAKLTTVYYANFYEDAAGKIILTRVQVPLAEDNTAVIDVSGQTVSAPEADLAFVGWSNQSGVNDDGREAITETTIDLAADGVNNNFYPIFKAAHWLSFYTAPAGSGATYIAPKYVLVGDTAAAAEPEEGSVKWTGYEFLGWFTNEDMTGDGDVEFNFDQALEKDVTVYAHWKNAVANYTVNYWQQQVTDEVNTADADKKYDFVGSLTRSAVRGTEVGPTDDDKALTSIVLNEKTVDFTGFSFNETNSTTTVEVAADGSTIVNVFYDRNVYSLVFTVAGPYYQDYVLATDDSGTQYAYVDGEYKQLERVAKTTTEYFLSYFENSDYEYTWGTIYSDTNGTVATEPYDTNATYYRRERAMGPGGGYKYSELYWRTRDTTTYTWQLDGEDYDGARYKNDYTRSHIIKRITALYGQSISNYFPIQGDDGKDYSGYLWSEPAQTIFKAKVATIDIMPAANVSFTGTEEGKDVPIYYYVEIVEGEDTTGLTTSEFNGKTFKLYKTAYIPTGWYLTYEEDFSPLVGFERNVAWSDPAFHYDNSEGMYIAELGNANAFRLYYERKTYSLTFYDSANNEVLDSQSVQYEHSLEDYIPTTTPTSSVPGKVFKGWYKDAAGDEEFDFTETMPAHAVQVYAVWDDVWYRIEVDPNGGQLTEGESTFFWETYGDVVEEYGDVTRDYVEDKNGTYYYLYHPYDELVEFDEEGNNAYSNPLYYAYWDRIATYSESDLVNNYSNYNSETGGYDTTTLVKDPISDLTVKYSYEKGAYALIGWYVVNEDGSLGAPYNFGSLVTGNLKLKAMWRRTGEYSVKYSSSAVDASGNPLLTDEGERVEALSVPSDTNSYADKSNAAFAVAPEVPAGYQFDGWYLDLTEGEDVHNPGAVFVIDANMAVSEGTAKNIYVYPVFTKIEDVPVRVTHLTWYDNYTADPVEDTNYITDEDIQINASVDIKAATTFTREGYKFLGWARVVSTDNDGNALEGYTLAPDASLDEDDLFLKWVEATTATDPDTGDEVSVAAHYEAQNKDGEWVAVTQIAADENYPYHDLYAVWEGVYTIYHSGKNADDKGVKEECVVDGEPIKPYEFADSSLLYGGYYVKTLTGNAPCTLPEDGKAYDGANWTWTTPGTTVEYTPSVGDVIYLKEVPTTYLVTTQLNTYQKDIKFLRNMYLTTAVDDTNYKKTGFVTGSTYTEADNCLKTVTIQFGANSTVDNNLLELTANSVADVPGGYVAISRIFELDSTADEDMCAEAVGTQTLTGVTDYLGYYSGIIGTKVIRSYWITPDGVTVTGAAVRVLMVGDNNSNKFIDVIVGDTKDIVFHDTSVKSIITAPATT